MSPELTDTQCFIFLHPTDITKAWSVKQGEGWTTVHDDWWRTQDLQKYGEKQLELSIEGCAYRTILLDFKPVEIESGAWALQMNMQVINLKQGEVPEEGEEWKNG